MAYDPVKEARRFLYGLALLIIAAVAMIFVGTAAAEIYLAYSSS